MICLEHLKGLGTSLCEWRARVHIGKYLPDARVLIPRDSVIVNVTRSQVGNVR